MFKAYRKAVNSADQKLNGYRAPGKRIASPPEGDKRPAIVIRPKTSLATWLKRLVSPRRATVDKDAFGSPTDVKVTFTSFADVQLTSRPSGNKGKTDTSEIQNEDRIDDPITAPAPIDANDVSSDVGPGFPISPASLTANLSVHPKTTSKPSKFLELATRSETSVGGGRNDTQSEASGNNDVDNLSEDRRYDSADESEIEERVIPQTQPNASKSRAEDDEQKYWSQMENLASGTSADTDPEMLRHLSPQISRGHYAKGMVAARDAHAKDSKSFEKNPSLVLPKELREEFGKYLEDELRQPANGQGALDAKQLGTYALHWLYQLNDRVLLQKPTAQDNNKGITFSNAFVETLNPARLMEAFSYLQVWRELASPGDRSQDLTLPLKPPSIGGNAGAVPTPASSALPADAPPLPQSFAEQPNARLKGQPLPASTAMPALPPHFPALPAVPGSDTGSTSSLKPVTDDNAESQSDSPRKPVAAPFAKPVYSAPPADPPPPLPLKPVSNTVPVSTDSSHESEAMRQLKQLVADALQKKGMDFEHAADNAFDDLNWDDAGYTKLNKTEQEEYREGLIKAATLNILDYRTTEKPPQISSIFSAKTGQANFEKFARRITDAVDAVMLEKLDEMKEIQKKAKKAPAKTTDKAPEIPHKVAKWTDASSQAKRLLSAEEKLKRIIPERMKNLLLNIDGFQASSGKNKLLFDFTSSLASAKTEKDLRGMVKLGFEAWKGDHKIGLPFVNQKAMMAGILMVATTTEYSDDPAITFVQCFPPDIRQNIPPLNGAQIALAIEYISSSGVVTPKFEADADLIELKRIFDTYTKYNLRVYWSSARTARDRLLKADLL